MRIPAIGVNAALEPLQVAGQQLRAPGTFSDAGWWRDGPEPGEPGAAVVVGHVDSRTGPAVFFRLRELTAGATVGVLTAAGERLSFRVVAVERYPKNRLPLARVFGPTPTPSLRLITCGGPFSRARRSYRDNVVVYAVRA